MLLVSFHASAVGQLILKGEQESLMCATIHVVSAYVVRTRSSFGKIRPGFSMAACICATQKCHLHLLVLASFYPYAWCTGHRWAVFIKLLGCRDLLTCR